LAASKPPKTKKHKKTMIISKVLLKDLIANYLKQENGLNEVLEFTLNAMMAHERSLHLEDAAGNKANGYRPGRVYGHGKLLELHIPRERNGEVLSESLSPSALPAGRNRQTGKCPVRARAHAVASRRRIRAPVWPPLQLLAGRAE
jgi:hypothetical protein